MRSREFIESTIKYFSETYADPRKTDILEVVGDETYRVRCLPVSRIILTNEWKRKDIEVGTNCMTFSLGQRQLGYAHPDIYDPEFVEYLRSEGKAHSPERQLLSAFQRSGFEQIKAHESTAKDHIIAVATLPFGENGDFHCYRLTAGGWIHKPGNAAITALDGSDKPIAMPHECDRDSYTNFMGYFKVPETGVRVVTTPSPLTLDLMG